MLSLEEMKTLSKEEQTKLFKRLSEIRQKGKKTVYSSMYGIGVDKLAREMSISKKEAKMLLDAYWEINWAIKAASEGFKIKTVEGSLWVLNPVSNIWHSLRKKHDVWSTINQSTGVYCFDKWIGYVLRKRRQLNAQFHDEIVLQIKKGNRDKSNKLLQEAIDAVNNELQLNVKLSVDIKYGDRYSDIH